MPRRQFNLLIHGIQELRLQTPDVNQCKIVIIIIMLKLHKMLKVRKIYNDVLAESYFMKNEPDSCKVKL